MLPVISALLAFVAGLFRSRASLCLEHLALRHQLAVYQQTVVSRLWPGWRDALVVQPRTVIAWQQQRFRDHWRRLSQQGTPGRPAVAKEVRELIQAMWQANPTWGSPRIVGELRKVGIDVTKSTVEKYRVRPRKPPSPTWKTFLNNHVKDLVAMDFFVVPTVTHKVLFVLVILAQSGDGRAFQCHGASHRRVDRPAGHGRVPMGRNAAISPARSGPRLWRLLSAAGAAHGDRRGGDCPRSPWQNPYVERLIGSIRRECLDHVIVLHERHLRRLLTGYFSYYHAWRTHRALDMDAPVPRRCNRRNSALYRGGARGRRVASSL